MEIEWLPLDAIRPYWRNPRNNEMSIPAVQASIEKFGWQQPLVLDADGVIVAGHTRYAAAKRMGLEKVPCLRFKLSAKDAKAFRIADNKTAEIAEWNFDKLIQELRELSNPHDELAGIFPRGELDDLLADPGLSGFKPINEGRIVDEANRLKKQFDRESDMVRVMCPNCTTEFLLDRKKLEQVPGEEDDEA